MTHTPGPWRYEPATRTIRSEPANYWLATLDSWDGAIREQNDSNARIMAASPKLLEALLVALPYVEDALDSPVFKRQAVRAHVAQIRAAIAAAEG